MITNLPAGSQRLWFAPLTSGEAGPDEVIFLPPGGGRSYQAGPMRAVFKADGPETDDRY